MVCKSATWAFGIVSVIFAFVPESFFRVIGWIPTQTVQRNLADRGITNIEIDIIISKMLCFAIICG